MMVTYIYSKALKKKLSSAGQWTNQHKRLTRTRADCNQQVEPWVDGNRESSGGLCFLTYFFITEPNDVIAHR